MRICTEVKRRSEASGVTGTWPLLSSSFWLKATRPIGIPGGYSDPDFELSDGSEKPAVTTSSPEAIDGVVGQLLEQQLALGLPTSGSSTPWSPTGILDLGGDPDRVVGDEHDLDEEPVTSVTLPTSAPSASTGSPSLTPSPEPALTSTCWDQRLGSRDDHLAVDRVVVLGADLADRG